MRIVHRQHVRQRDQRSDTIDLLQLGYLRVGVAARSFLISLVVVLDSLGQRLLLPGTVAPERSAARENSIPLPVPCGSVRDGTAANVPRRPWSILVSHSTQGCARSHQSRSGPNPCQVRLGFRAAMLHRAQQHAEDQCALIAPSVLASSRSSLRVLSPINAVRSGRGPRSPRAPNPLKCRLTHGECCPVSIAMRLGGRALNASLSPF